MSRNDGFYYSYLLVKKFLIISGLLVFISCSKKVHTTKTDHITPGMPLRTSKEVGYLTVNSVPWANIKIDGKFILDEKGKIDQTPIIKYELAVGKHTLEALKPVETFGKKYEIYETDIEIGENEPSEPMYVPIQLQPEIVLKENYNFVRIDGTDRLKNMNNTAIIISPRIYQREHYPIIIEEVKKFSNFDFDSTLLFSFSTASNFENVLTEMDNNIRKRLWKYNDKAKTSFFFMCLPQDNINYLKNKINSYGDKGQLLGQVIIKGSCD